MHVTGPASPFPETKIKVQMLQRIIILFSQSLFGGCRGTCPNLRNLGFLGPDFGHIFWSLFGFPFLEPFWAFTIPNKIKGSKNGTRKMEPKTKTKIGPNQVPKCNPGPQICTETQTKTYRDDLHSAVCWMILFKCATNQQLQLKKEGLGGQNCSNREHEYIHRPNVVLLPEDTQSSLAKSTACLLLWKY